MAFGTYKAPFPRGRVLRGWDPQNPTKQTKGLPVKKETKPNGMKGSERIYPGHIITAKPDGTTVEWTKGIPYTGGVDSKANYAGCLVAVASAASTDLDVVNAKSLVGLEMTDSFRIATPFFKKGETYTVGTKLTACAADEEDTDGRSLAGYVRPANTGEVVVGIVAEAGPVNLQESFTTALDSSSIRENAYYVIYDTAYQPASPTA